MAPVVPPLLCVVLLMAACGGSSDESGDPAAGALRSSAVTPTYGSGNMSDNGLNLMPPPAISTEATLKLDGFAARMVADGRCSTVRRHYSAVVATGIGIGCLRSSDLLIESGILAADPMVMRTAIEHIDRFAVLDDRTAGSVELFDEYVVLLIENLDATFTLAVDTIASATDNQSINDVLLAKGQFVS